MKELSEEIMVKIQLKLTSFEPAIFDKYDPVLPGCKFEAKDMLNADDIDDDMMIVRTYSNGGIKDSDAALYFKKILDGNDIKYEMYNERSFRIKTHSFINKFNIK